MLNGTFWKEQPAEFTYLFGARKRQIDNYFILLTNVIPLLVDLKVVPNFFSEHLLVLLLLKIASPHVQCAIIRRWYPVKGEYIVMLHGHKQCTWKSKSYLLPMNSRILRTSPQ